MVATVGSSNFNEVKEAPNYFGAESLAWDKYHEVRPTYPQSLFDLLFAYHARHSDSFELALDFGSGPGTILPALLEKFRRVEGSDLNSRQIELGRTALEQRYGKERVEMHVGAAGSCDWKSDGQVDLFTAAEAVHWFDQPRWIKEAGSKLRRGGTLAFWYYSPNCTIVSHPSAASSCARLFSILFEANWTSDGFSRRPIESHAYKLDNIAIDPTLFANEERHKWSLPETVAGPFGLGENEPTSRKLVPDVGSGVSASAKEVEHGSEGRECYLVSQDWTTKELLEYIDSLGMPMDSLLEHPDYQATMDHIHKEVGGENGRFRAGWWLSLVMATKR